MTHTCFRLVDRLLGLALLMVVWAPCFLYSQQYRPRIPLPAGAVEHVGLGIGDVV